MIAGLVIRTHDNRLTILLLNKPAELNALNHELFAERRARILAIQNDENVGCVILRGAGKYFSASHDLGGISEIVIQVITERDRKSPTL